jgi:hypothetical protein
MNGLQYASAFVVQFRANTDFDLGQVEGRVEHVASGRTGSFESADELMERFAGLLKDATSTVQNPKAADYESSHDDVD